MDIIEFYNKIAEFSPNPLQQAVWQEFEKSGGHPALLVKAGTGAGKTEAVLFPALADEKKLRRIIMIMPSKALIEDMGERVKDIGKKLSEHKIKDIDITVDMGGTCKRFCCQNGEVHENNHFRHLFADDIIITTLDKFLFRMFGYGEKIKSYIFPHRIFGSALEKKPFVIFDEAHEYDGTAFSNFIKLLETLFIKGKDLCIMSATLPEKFVDFLTPVNSMNGELGNLQNNFQGSKTVNQDKYLTLISINPVSAIAEQVRNHYDKSKRIIARTEYVKDLVKLYDELKDLNPLIYHGRMTSKQRSGTIKELITQQKNDQGFLVLATSAIEAGCDLDAHVIITELCNPDSLVQLAGRLNRRGQMENAKLIIAGNTIKPLVSVLNQEQLENYINDLKSMGSVFKPESLQKYFNPPQRDWMGEILFDMLWEYVYEADLTSKPLWDKGIIVTRSWEPSVTLCTGIDEKTKKPENPVQIGISRLAKRINKPFEELKKQRACDWLSVDENSQWHADVHRAFYNTDNWEENRWSLYPLPEKYAISCYETNLICEIKKEFISEYFDMNLGYIKIPKIFLKGYRDGFRQYLDYQPKIKAKDGCFSIGSGKKYPEHSGRVWYLDVEK
ncbi:Putative CRISPR-associated helicase Cas3 [Desulfonema limicola]|uniref:RNA helicase n=1 Tax=Desulfonema limicola TaxID=45656 RepID=A0A975GH69_9BACT|nr:CRISPR-associated helicase Cas3' [Desulfonema limicola]QTA81101.1 Putative CRISPR-associated helicase Cas3 [Desulfonema limicola]